MTQEKQHLQWQQKKIKYLGVNLIRNLQNLYEEHFKIAMKERRRSEQMTSHL